MLILTIMLSVVNVKADDLTGCPNGYAIRFPKKGPFPGAYVPCENFDEVFRLLDKGQYLAAKKLLINVKGQNNNYRHKYRGLKRINIPVHINESEDNSEVL